MNQDHPLLLKRHSLREISLNGEVGAGSSPIYMRWHMLPQWRLLGAAGSYSPYNGWRRCGDPQVHPTGDKFPAHL